jgi:hypothetical protein
VRRLLFALGLVLSGPHAEAACNGFSPTWSTTTCTAADVQACLNSTQVGDTVNVSAGTCAWTPQDAFTAAVYINGKSLKIIVLAPDECRSSGLGYRRGPNDPTLLG